MGGENDLTMEVAVPRTLDEGFQSLLDSVTPDGSELDAVGSYREEIRECLDSNFGLYAFFLGGSFLNDTGIAGYSSVDYFASVDDAGLPSDSTLFLDEVGRALDERFPDAGVTVRAPAVAVPLGAGASDTVRVIPARLAGQTGAGHRVYEIADGAGGWMKSSPDGHSARIAVVDRELGGRLRPLVRLLKAWRYLRDVPISSFYLELRCVEYAAGEKMIVYPVDLRNVLELLWDDQFGDMYDVEGVSGRISARLARVDRKMAVSRLRTALYHIGRADDAAAEGNMEETFQYWNRVFNGRFPPYG